MTRVIKNELLCIEERIEREKWIEEKRKRSTEIINQLLELQNRH